MIGNDVIDLKLASKESTILRKAVQDKIFTAAEKNRINNNAQPATIAWLCWSQKEAAYKIVNRMISYRFYAPKAFESCLTPIQDKVLSAMAEFVAFDSNEPVPVNISLTGMVRYKEQTFYTLSFIDSDKIITVAAVNPDFVTVKQKISALFDRLNQQDIISSFLKNTGFEFYKDCRGIPFLKNKSISDLPATLSHHGHYISLAWKNQPGKD